LGEYTFGQGCVLYLPLYLASGEESDVQVSLHRGNF